MHQPQNPTPQQSIDQDYEISILDILVVLAENLRLIILVPVVVGLLALGITFVIPPTYQSTSLLNLGEGTVPSMNSEEVFSKVLEQTDWIKASTREEALKNLRKNLHAIFVKQNNIVKITSEGSTPSKATTLNTNLIDSYRVYSLPKGKVLDAINENIRIGTENLANLEDVAKKISQNVDKVTPGWEGDNVARAYATITSTIATQKINLFSLKQSLNPFGPEVIIQEPTLPEKPIKPKKAQITIMATLASGFLTILFVFIRAAFRNLVGDAEVSHKLSRTRECIGLKPIKK
jgi:LPS O-antigen subunit length determinant protein (WzzB/FepE family)